MYLTRLQRQPKTQLIQSQKTNRKRCASCISSTKKERKWESKKVDCKLTWSCVRWKVRGATLNILFSFEIRRISPSSYHPLPQYDGLPCYKQIHKGGRRREARFLLFDPDYGISPRPKSIRNVTQQSVGFSCFSLLCVVEWSMGRFSSLL